VISGCYTGGIIIIIITTTIITVPVFVSSFLSCHFQCHFDTAQHGSFLRVSWAHRLSAKSAYVGPKVMGLCLCILLCPPSLPASFPPFPLHLPSCTSAYDFPPGLNLYHPLLQRLCGGALHSCGHGWLALQGWTRATPPTCPTSGTKAATSSRTARPCTSSSGWPLLVRQAAAPSCRGRRRRARL